MKKFYKIMQTLWVVAALMQMSLGKIEYAIFAMLWAILLELFLLERK